MAFKRDGMNKNSLTAKRGVILLVLFAVILMGACILRIGYLSVIKGETYREKAERQQLSDSSLSATRGTIYDSNMNVLAQSASVWLIYVNPSKVTQDNIDKVVNGLVDILEIDGEKLREDIAKNASKGYLKVKSQIEYTQQSALKEYISENELVNIICIDPDTKRYYPNASLASTVIGFTGVDGNGLYGIEYFYDDLLTGTDGRIITAKDGVQSELMNAYEIVYDAQQGLSLVLTINSEIQTILTDALAAALKETGAKNVYGIVSETSTGAILAMANLPDYDPNNPSEITSQAALDKIAAAQSEEEQNKLIQEARYSQWKNKSIADFYFPGSVFKTFLVAAALEENVITDSTSYTCHGTISTAGRTIKDYNPKGHGAETPRTLLVNSCNTFSVVVGQKLGIDLFYKYYEAFGFTERTGIDINGEDTPKAGVAYYDPDVSFSASDLASASFGQGNSVTPLQIINAISAIGNGGHLMTPYIVDKVLDSEGNIVKETTPIEKRQVISETTAAQVADYMKDVVNTDKGTGKNAYAAGYAVAGKTGTSEKLSEGEGVYIASFAGFAPYDDPVISVVIIIDEPKGYNYSGGAIAAPVAGEVFEKALKYLGVEQTFTEEELAEMIVETPEVTGKEVDAAKKELEGAGYTVRIIGDGTTVISQSPEAGRSIPSNGAVILYTKTDSEKQMAVVPDFTGLTVSQANKLAVSRGLNIKISGSSASNSEVVAYRQETEIGSEVEQGTVITVYFKTTVGVGD